MAATSEVSTIVLDPMRALYRTPHGIDSVEDSLGEYAKILRRFDAGALERGWERAVQRHKRRDWPSIAELIEAIRGAQPLPPKPAARATAALDDTRSPDEISRVKRMFEIWHKHGKSFADMATDQEFLEMRGEFMARHGCPMLPIEFRDRALQFINRNRQTKKDFKQAGVSTVLHECVLRFKDREGVKTISEFYGDQLNAFMGFEVRLEVEPVDADERPWVQPRWSEEADYWAPKPPLFSSTPYLARDHANASHD